MSEQCICEQVDTTPRQCPVHFSLWRYGKRLTSVSRIVKMWFPMDTNINPEVLENARLRGKEVDLLFALWIKGELPSIPAGTSEEGKGLLIKLMEWFNGQHFSKYQTQVVLGDTDHGGIVDFVFDAVPYDLKCNSGSIPHAARLQVAGYSVLHGVPGKVIQVNKQLKRAMEREITREDMDDWQRILEAWRVVRKRSKYEEPEVESNTWFVALSEKRKG